MISRSSVSQDIQDFSRNVDPGPHVHSELEPEVDTIGIYVENHEGVNQEWFIWIRSDNRKLGENGSRPALLEDPLISETCPLEESASHHESGHEWSLPTVSGVTRDDN